MILYRPNRGYRAGALRQRFTLQAASETVDDNGQTIRTWSNSIVDEPCQVVPTAGTESIHGRQVEAGISAVFIVRFRASTYTPEKRLRYDGSTYGIVYVKQVDGGRRFIELHCRSVVDA